MPIKVSTPTSQPAVTFDSLFLVKFQLDQELADHAPKSVSLRTYLSGHDDNGAWSYDPGTRWDFSHGNVDALAVEMHCKATGCTPAHAAAEYSAAMQAAAGLNFLQCMAAFAKGIAILYESQHGDGGAEVAG